MDFGTLKERLHELLGRPAIALSYDMACADLDRTLRIREMEETATIAASSGSLPLPSNFLEPKSLRDPEGAFLHPIGYEQIEADPHTYRSAQYVVGNGSLTITPAPEDGVQFDLIYFAKNGPLVDQGDTNAALRGAPETYVFTVLTNHARLIRDTAALQFWESQALKSVADANRAAMSARYNGGTLEVMPGGQVA